MRARARREMAVARGAAPVWIMPLNEAYPTEGSCRFPLIRRRS